MEVVQWEKQCTYAIIWAINEAQNHKPDLSQSLMSESPVLTDGWTLSHILTGRNLFLYMSRLQGHGDYSACPSQSSAILRWKDSVQCLLSENHSPCLRKERKNIPPGLYISVLFVIFCFKLPNFISWLLLLHSSSLQHHIQPHRASVGTASVFSRSFQAFVGIF